MSGDFVIGLIVFAILLTINFVVITKGATRIAEVGARFTLDAIPGKQMAIDADLSAGLINDKEAQRRRRELEEESAFFGSMDGASKFVRGDAVAGLIILAVNVFGGIVIGVTRHGMPLGQAADVFAKLSVGDGLVSQIPALIVSLGAALLVSKGGTRGSADKAVLDQLVQLPARALRRGAAAVRAGAGAGPAVLSLRAARRHRCCSSATRSRARLAAARRPRPRRPPAAERSAAASRPRIRSRRSCARPRSSSCLGKQLGAKLLASRRRARPPRRQDAAQVRAAIRLRGARDQGHRQPRRAAQVLPDQDPRHRRGRARSCGSATCWSSPATAASPTCPATEAREPAFGMKAMWIVGRLCGRGQAPELPGRRHAVDRCSPT